MPPTPFDIPFPAGVACEFALLVTIAPSAHTVQKVFTDADGNTVRTIQAGRGSALTFTRVATGDAVSLKSNGFSTQQSFNPDGSYAVVNTGHTVILISEQEDPEGASTTLYTGRVTFTATADDVFTITGSSGRTRDICAELD
ncbi:hypothetical protein GCM10009777_23870 [Microbacterium pumilum]|uniref:Uncharacterized protein n=1 Tax=Microbacterium pumilum TaxID=344165 RepID=A0ABP5DZI1_9MICO